MIGMAKTSQRKAKAVPGKPKDLSPSKVLAIVANWNNTSPVKASPRRKRSRDEKLSASVPRSRRQKKSFRKDYLSTSSDDDDVPSFRAKSFYHTAKRTKYLSPFERKEELERLIDAGIDPNTLNKSFDELQRDRSRSRSLPRSNPMNETNGTSSAKLKAKTLDNRDARSLPTASVKKSTHAPAAKVNGNASTGRQRRPVQSWSGTMSGVKGEIKVTLSERSPDGGSEVRRSPRKSKAPPALQVQWRTSPRKSVLKTTATKGIQMYVKNMKSSQKGKKTQSNQKVKAPPKEKTSQSKAKATKPKTTEPSTAPQQQGVHTDPNNDKTARGLDFGISAVDGNDVAPLDKSFEEAGEMANNRSADSELMDFLVFHDEDFQDEAKETEDFVQNLLMEIDEDLEQTEALMKRSPRKRKMKTEQESMSSPSSGKGTPNRRRISSTPLSSKKSSQPRLDDWLTPLEAKKTSSPAQKKSAIQRSKVMSVGTVALTPESSSTSSPKAPSPVKAVKLYPVFTPPTSPHARSNGTPTNKKKQGIVGNVKSPKESKRSPLLKSLKSKNDSMEQLTLDLGQKRFGAVTCSTCGTVYTAAHPGDEADHAKFHKKYLSSIKFPGWKQEEVLEEFHDGRVIVVTHDAPRFAEKKVDEIRELVDRELGFLEGNPMACKDLCKTYLFITMDKKVGGCLIAEQITKGYRVIVEDQRAGGNLNESQKAWCCETESEPALCGISRIWVPMATRRRGIASRMVNCLRKNFMFGTVLSPDDIAFSDPTPDGKTFATKYTGTPRFLVYKYH